MHSAFSPKRSSSLKIGLSKEERKEAEAVAAYLRVSLAEAFRRCLAAEFARVKSLKAA